MNPKEKEEVKLKGRVSLAKASLNPYIKSVYGKIGIVTAIAAVLLVAMMGSASAQDPGCVKDGDTSVVYRCGDTVGFSCTFNGSMDCPSGTHGLVVETSNIIIDGAGYTISGGVVLNDCGACAEGGQIGNHCRCGVALDLFNNENITIKNLEVKNFCNGIAVKGPASEITIENCSVHDNGISTAANVGQTHGITVDNKVCNSTITECEIYNNTGEDTEACGLGGAGIKFFGLCSYNNITNNTIHNNHMSGIYSKMKCEHCNVTYNIVRENGYSVEEYGGGIRLMCKLTNYWIVENNEVLNNTGPGIFVGGVHNIIKYNLVNNNSDNGIDIGRSDGSDYNELYYNTICNNGGADISTCGGTTPWTGCYGNHGDNNTCDTASNYCDDSADCPPPCVYQCAGEGADLEITNLEFATWIVEGENYTINYTVTNTGVDPAGASDTGIYINGAWVQDDSVHALPASASYSSTLGPFPVTGATGLDTVKACADDNHEVMESNEDNNCHEDTFCGPDLVITDFHEEWIDSGTWKRYNLSYTVKNVGDIATTDDCWTNFTELNGEWSDCINPVPISAGLAVGATEARIVGPFVMEGGGDWLQAWVNFNYTCPVNEWNKLHHDRARFMPSYGDSGGCCGDCGNVDCSGGIQFVDYVKLRKHYLESYELHCYWAGDIDCIGGIQFVDYVKLRKHYLESYELHCCTGGCQS